MSFHVTLIEHGVSIATIRARSISQAISWAESILTVQSTRAYLGAFGIVVATFDGAGWTRHPFTR